MGFCRLFQAIIDILRFMSYNYEMRLLFMKCAYYTRYDKKNDYFYYIIPDRYKKYVILYKAYVFVCNNKHYLVKYKALSFMRLFSKPLFLTPPALVHFKNSFAIIASLGLILTNFNKVLEAKAPLPTL